MVMVTGCTGPTAPGTGSGSTGTVTVTSFEASDNTLLPGQTATVTAVISNTAQTQAQVEAPELASTGQLNVASTTCTEQTLRPKTEQVTPRYECSWQIEAPENVEPPLPKKYEPTLFLNYSSSLRTETPVRIETETPGTRENVEEIQETYSNEDLQMSITYDKPGIPSGTTLEFSLKPSSQGKITSNYEISYNPSIESCPSSVTPESISGSRQFECSVSTSSPTTVPYVVNVDYKYLKTQQISIEVSK
jgi:hypothetical protein